MTTQRDEKRKSNDWVGGFYLASWYERQGFDISKLANVPEEWKEEHPARGTTYKIPIHMMGDHSSKGTISDQTIEGAFAKQKAKIAADGQIQFGSEEGLESDESSESSSAGGDPKRIEAKARKAAKRLEAKAKQHVKTVNAKAKAQGRKAARKAKKDLAKKKEAEKMKAAEEAKFEKEEKLAAKRQKVEQGVAETICSKYTEVISSCTAIMGGHPLRGLARGYASEGSNPAGRLASWKAPSASRLRNKQGCHVQD